MPIQSGRQSVGARRGTRYSEIGLLHAAPSGLPAIGAYMSALGASSAVASASFNSRMRACIFSEISSSSHQGHCTAVSKGTSNSSQRSSNRKTRVNRRSGLPYNGTTWRCDRLLLNEWRPPFEVPRKTAK
jgi:hypothetical protein